MPDFLEDVEFRTGAVGGVCLLLLLAYLFYVMRTPRDGTYLVVHGDSCWVVKGLHVSGDTSRIWWSDPKTGHTITMSGARHAQVPPGKLAEVARALNARGCLGD